MDLSRLRKNARTALMTSGISPKRVSTHITGSNGSNGSGRSPGQTISGYASSPSNLMSNSANRTDWHRADQYAMFQSTPFSIITNIANRLSEPEISIGIDTKSQNKKPNGERRFTKSMLPKNLKNKADQIEVIEEHPIYKVIEKPNPLFTWYQLKWMTFVGTEVFGEYFWVMDKIKNTDDDGKPDGTWRGMIFPIPPHWVKDMVLSNGKISEDQKLIQPPFTGEGQPVSVKQLAHFKYPDAYDPFGVISPLQAMARCVSIDAACEFALEAGMRNSANPGLAIITGRPPEFSGMTGIGNDQVALSETQRDELMSWFRDRYQGFTRNGEPLILDALIKDVKQINSNLKEIDNSTIAKMVEDRLYRAFKVNRISMGDFEAANRASAVVADDHLRANCLNPRNRMFNDTLTASLGVYFQDERGPVQVFQEIEVIHDPEFVLRETVELVQVGIMSRLEGRKRHDLPERPDDEEFDEAIIIGHGSDPTAFSFSDSDGDGLDDDTGKPANGGEDESDDNDDAKAYNARHGWGDWDSVEGRHKWRLRVKQAQAETREQRAGIKQVIESHLLDVISEHFEKAGEEARKKFSNETPEMLVARIWPEKAIESQIVGLVESLAGKLAKEIVEREYARYRASKSVEVRIKDASGDAVILKTLEQRVLGKVQKSAAIVVSIVKRIYGWLVRKLTLSRDAIQDDDSAIVTQEAAKVFADEFVNRVEAAKITGKFAEIVSTPIFNESRNEVVSTLRKTGRVKAEVWSTQKDDRVRGTHRGVHGQVKSDGHFTVGGYHCEYPGDESLPDKEREGCRCFVSVVYRSSD